MKKIVRLLHSKVRTALLQAVRAMQRTWSAHQDLLRHNPAYEAALAAAAAGLIVQASIERLVTALVAGLLGIWVAIRRGAAWPERASFEDRW